MVLFINNGLFLIIITKALILFNSCLVKAHFCNNAILSIFAYSVIQNKVS
jgi:hypothetical protein